MIQKLTLEQFREIKKSMLNLIELAEQRYSSENQDQSEKEKFLREYNSLQDRLLSSDLSDIPFEEWRGLYIFTDGELDLSKTHANIDFSLLGGIEYDSINFQGCNIRGIYVLDYDETTFDAEYMKTHPEYFPDESIPTEVRQLFYDKKLSFLDLLEYPALRKCVNEYSFSDAHFSPSYGLVNAIGFENAIRLYDENPVFVCAITFEKERNSYSNDKFNFRAEKPFDKSGTYEEAKQFVYRQIIYEVSNRYLVKLPPINFLPQDMIDSLPNVFIKDNELPEIVAEKYYDGKLSIRDIRKYSEVLRTKDLKLGTYLSSEFLAINKVFGDVWKFIENVPEEYDDIVARYLSKYAYDEEKIAQISQQELSDIISDSIRNALNGDSWSRRYYNLDELYAFSQYVPIEEIFEDASLRDFVQRCSFENIVKFNRKNNMILERTSESYSSNTLLQEMLEYVDEIGDFTPINDEQQLTTVFEKIIHQMRLSGKRSTKAMLSDNKRRLCAIFPREFLDYYMLDNLLGELEKEDRELLIKNLEMGFNGDTYLLFDILNKNPSLLPALVNKNLIITEFDNSLNKFYQQVGNERFLNICSKYGMALCQVISSLRNDSDKKAAFLSQMLKDNYIYYMNEYVYNSISNCDRMFDLRILPQSFKSEFPDLFLDDNAPKDLQDKFYGKSYARNKYGLLTASDIHNNPKWIPYLLKVDLRKCLSQIYVDAYDSENKNSTIPNYIQRMNLYDILVAKFSREELLDFISKYGHCIDNYDDYIDVSLEKKELYESMIEHIYEQFEDRKIVRIFKDMPIEFIEKYPELFLDDNAPKELQELFYKREISPQIIQKHPEWKTFLQGKNIAATCNMNVKSFVENCMRLGFDNNKVFELFDKYGEYITSCHVFIDDIDDDDIEELDNVIRERITYEIVHNNIKYDESAKSILGEEYSDLFLDEDVPENLKEAFYCYYDNDPLTFRLLKEHKDWLPYLEGKNVLLSLKKSKYCVRGLEQLFEKYGDHEATRMGIKNPKSVMKMLHDDKFDVLSRWYDKTGRKFIPDFVVMQNFKIDEIDKFLDAGSNWSTLMRIQSFANTQESRDALLKLAYSFGVFDQDQRGFKKLFDLLTCLPKKIDADKEYILKQIDDQIDLHSHRNTFYHNDVTEENGDKKIENANLTPEEKDAVFDKMVEYAKSNKSYDLVDSLTLVNLLETLKKEKVNIDFSMPILSQFYRKNDDDTFSLIVNAQSCPKTSQIIRSVLERFRELPLLSPEFAHAFFGGFELKYDPDFREFLLANMDIIMEKPEYASLTSSIQKQFSDIKAINSNRALTWELAMSYVQTNKFTSVNVGNERVAEISAIAGYSQADFDTLQQIYNYGKQRTFSSIPRIEQSTEKTSGRYTYETLRLDDPLAMAIGTLTDCCQELNNCAEVCMEHSMVDKNGRVFVIKDEQGNIVAQSWVWRNKDVLCFDNIEIPDKAFARTVREHPELGRKGFTDEVFEIYKQAAHDLIEADEKVYRELLESEKITQEQYDGLRLGKVTVGLGYNDIAESLKENSVVDRGTVSRPLPFEEPVKLSRGLYTNDSTTQYVLEERKDYSDFDGKTLPVHSDSYIEYTDSNFTKKLLFSLEKLEIATKGELRILAFSDSFSDYSEHIVTEIANFYGLNPETTRIVMNPNFAIIYDVIDDELRIGDLLFNTKIDNGQQQMDIESQVVMQIRLALEQIASGKKIDVSELDEKQKEMYMMATKLTDEIDIERGINHAK